MCGLAGVAGQYVNDKQRSIFHQLMIGATLRGMHATGVSSIFTRYIEDKDKPYYIVEKAVGPFWDLTERKGFDGVMKPGGQHKVLMGHCRHATVGSNMRSNAHPFVVNNSIIGMHNGTIRDGLEDEKLYGTDSEALWNMVDDYGIEQTIPKLKGAWALTWMDFRDHTFNLLRNSQRTLYLARVDSTQDLYWSSEGDLLTWVLNRNDVKDYKLLLLKEDVHVSCKIFERNWMSKDNVTMTEIKGKEESVTGVMGFPRSGAVNSQGWIYDHNTNIYRAPGAWQQERVSQGTTAAKTLEAQVQKALMGPATIPVTSSTEPSSKNEETGKTTTDKDTETRTEIAKPNGHLRYEHFPKGRMVSSGVIRSFLEMGCVVCEAVSPLGGKHRFYSQTVYLCESCDHDPETVKMIESRAHMYEDTIDPLDREALIQDIAAETEQVIQ